MRIARIATSLAVVALAITGAQLGVQVAAHADEDTVSSNLLHDGWDPNEPGLTPSAVTGGKFGQLFATHVDGQVYAQPLVVDNPGSGTTAPSTRVIVGTENDSVYSLDGATGAVIWKTSVGTAWSSSVAGCHDLWPQIGITSTPVYDPAADTIYVVADDAKGNANTTSPEFDLVALNEQSGAIEWRKAIPVHPTNDPTMTFKSEWQRQRAGLLMAANGWMYMSFASVCDHGTYAGYVAGVDTAGSNHLATLWTDESGTTSADPEAGIWQSGGGLVQMPGNPNSFYLTSGNGISPAPWSEGSTFPAQNNLQLGDAVMRLDIQSDGSLKAGDFFSPANAPVLAAGDRDYGSGGVVGLPFGTSTYPNLLVQAGKDGRVFLLNASSLGGRSATTDHVLSVSGPYAGQWGHVAAFAASTGAGYVYYSGSGYGSADYLRVLQLTGTSAAPTLTEVGNSAGQFGYTSGSPVVTSAGNDPSTAVVWEVNASDVNGDKGTLEAFDAIPSKGILPEIWSAPIGSAAKFAVAAADGGGVYVGTRGDSGTGAGSVPGVVYGFGVKGGTPPFTGAQQATLPDAGVNGTASAKNVTLTAARNVTVTGIAMDTASSPFTLGTPQVNGTPVASPVSASNPVSLTQGQQLTIPVTFTPAATGLQNGNLQLTTNVTGFTTVSVPLAATGTQPGLSADPTTLDFGANGSGNSNDPNTGPIPVGLSEPFQTDITNTGTTTLMITSAPTISGPFAVTGVKAGDVLKAGQSETATVTYTPTSVNPASNPVTGSLQVAFANSDGTNPGTTSVALSGISVAGKGTLTAAASSVNFGQVHLGQTAGKTVNFTNTGNLPVTVTRFTAPRVPFGTPTPIATNLTVNAGSEISLPVTYTPASNGTSTGSYQITTTDGHNPASTLTVSVTGTGVAPASGVAVPSPGGGWRVNGTARMLGTSLVLTPGWHNAAGSAVYYQPLATNGLRVTFRAQMSGNVGGDGMTFALVNPADTTSALGKDGALLGFGGLHGIAVVLGTHQDPGFPSANFIGIATGTTGTGASAHLSLHYTVTAIPNLRSGTHLIGIALSGTGSTRTLTAGIDGRQYIKATLTIPATVLPLFTAGTGATTAEAHVVSSVALSSPAGAVPPPGGGWSYNRSAQMSGSDTDLTPATTNQAGTVIYPRAIATTATSSLTAQFEMQIGGGNGANGVTFALLNPSTATTAVGGDGSGLALSGLTGMAVVFSTYPILGTASNNFVAIVTANGTNGLSLSSARVPVGQLRSGIHQVRVTLAGGALTVYLDGGIVASAKIPKSLPATSLLAFTGSTGGLTDVHAIRDVSIAASAW